MDHNLADGHATDSASRDGPAGAPVGQATMRRSSPAPVPRHVSANTPCSRPAATVATGLTRAAVTDPANEPQTPGPADAPSPRGPCRPPGCHAGPGRLPGRRPGQHLGRCPDQPPDRRSGRLPDRCLGQSPDRRPGRLPDQRPGRLPERRPGPGGRRRPHLGRRGGHPPPGPPHRRSRRRWLGHLQRPAPGGSGRVRGEIGPAVIDPSGEQCLRGRVVCQETEVRPAVLVRMFTPARSYGTRQKSIRDPEEHLTAAGQRRTGEDPEERPAATEQHRTGEDPEEPLTAAGRCRSLRELARRGRPRLSVRAFPAVGVHRGNPDASLALPLPVLHISQPA